MLRISSACAMCSLLLMPLSSSAAETSKGDSMIGLSFKHDAASGRFSVIRTDNNQPLIEGATASVHTADGELRLSDLEKIKVIDRNGANSIIGGSNSTAGIKLRLDLNSAGISGVLLTLTATNQSDKPIEIRSMNPLAGLETTGVSCLLSSKRVFTSQSG